MDLQAARAELRRRFRSPLYRLKRKTDRWGRRRLEHLLQEEAATSVEVPRPRPIDATARPERGSTGRPRVVVVAWSLSHNPAGRALTLADLLARSFDVELVGACFPAYGRGLWNPLSETTLAVRPYPGELLPAHWRRLEQVASELTADVVYVSKPRFPSLALGALAKAHTGRPLMIDVDDDEPALIGLDGPIALSALPRLIDAPSFRDPTGALWTGVAAGLIGAADQVTAANEQLGEKHAALVVPHARDERVFDPSLYDRAKERSRLGLPATDHVVMFAGTPGRYKGILEVAEAIRQIGDPRYKLCVIGRPMDRRLVREVKRAARGHLRWLGERPLHELPANLAAADLVCVLQDPSSPVARMQTPAKVTDALAMGVPILGTPTAPLAALAGRGLLTLVEDAPLSEQLRHLINNADEARHRAVKNRQVFLREFSYAAVAPTLSKAVHARLDAPATYSPALDELVEFCRARF